MNFPTNQDVSKMTSRVLDNKKISVFINVSSTTRIRYTPTKWLDYYYYKQIFVQDVHLISLPDVQSLRTKVGVGHTTPGRSLCVTKSCHRTRSNGTQTLNIFHVIVRKFM